MRNFNDKQYKNLVQQLVKEVLAEFKKRKYKQQQANNPPNLADRPKELLKKTDDTYLKSINKKLIN